MKDDMPAPHPRPADELLATVSHELRQPLASIRGLTEMLLGHWADFSDNDKTDMLREVHHNAARVGCLVDELLEASRSVARPPVLQRRETDMAALVARVARSLKISHPELEVSVEQSPRLPKALVDPFKVEQVLANLLENAGQHGSAAGVQVAATLRSARGDDVVEISVSDKGNGIAPGDLPHITEKFFRAAKGRGDGLGLGLWISRQIVEAHGGELMASSVPGEGTTLRFTIPLHPRPAAGKLAGK
jgi:signal transduction histidine kinase